MATALITGGTSGIGFAFARAFAARGDDLVLVARDEARLARVAEELRARHGVAVEELAADLSQRDQAQRVADRLEESARPVEILINNAGFSVGSPLLAESMERHDVSGEVMMRTVVLLQGAAGRAMSSRGSGTIVNLSSVAGSITQGHYSAIKAYVRVLTESLAVELAGTGVRVCALCPGWVRTEFHSRAGIKGSSIPGFLWLKDDDVVRGCLRDLERGKVISVPDVRYRVATAFLRHAPRRIVRAISGKLSSARRNE
ncbi:SDR family NAD(P)-dependent oxidoreductase [Nigerium massiliense]|uniref:SDR family NAD(P)-dependent oxidoreductase n=1 Tax=Nigerium massiliense TaxID=1522317 RepID=UPI00058CDDBC|nr:SDR family NAD(P)-dependent oxidoreductase [Nigerium massiliense]